MKLNISAHKATGAGFKEVTKFKMDMNAKAARVLSDTLYKDKIGSIIREICCNAFDAHIEVGHPEQPFKVKLPDVFDPTFSVRDFGPGLSHEDIEGIYTTYFGSTKDQTNDSVGAFGLGSKTPFSYTDSFMVTSIYRGVKRVYNAYLEEGLPQISMFGEGEKTDEPDGLEVTVTIDPKDFEKFRNSLIRQLRFFPVKPEADVEWPTIEKTIVEIGEFTYFQSNKRIMEGCFIKQGPVAYPLDFDFIRDYYNTHVSKGNIYTHPGWSFIQFLESINRQYRYSGQATYYGVCIEMPIGTVEVTAGRESISYTQETMHNICVTFDRICSKMFDSIKHKLDEAFASSKGEFYSMYRDLPGFMVSTFPREDFNKAYAPFYIDEGRVLRLMLPDKFADLQVSVYDSVYGKAKKVLHACNVDYNEKDFKSEILTYLLHDKSIYYKDENYAFVTRARNASENKQFCVIELPENKYKSFINFLDGVTENIIRVSTLPMPSRNTKSGGHSITDGKKRSWFYLNNSVFRNTDFSRTLYSDRCEQEFNQSPECCDVSMTFVCFNTHNNKIGDNGLPAEILSLVFNYVRCETDNYRCIGIANAELQKALKHNPSQFIHVKDYFEKNKDVITKAVRDSVKGDITKLYESMVNVHINRNKLFYILQKIKNSNKPSLIGLDDVVVTFDEYKNSIVNVQKESFLCSMNPTMLNEAMGYLGLDSVVTFWNDAQNLMYNTTSLKRIERYFKASNIPFLSMVNNHKKIEKMFKNPLNRKEFLNLVVDGKIDERSVIRYGHDIDTIVLDPIKIAKEIISDIA